MKKTRTNCFFLKLPFFKVDGELTLSTTLSSVAYGEKLASIVEVNFNPESNQVVKAKQSMLRDCLSKNFTTVSESVVEIGGTIIVSF